MLNLHLPMIFHPNQIREIVLKIANTLCRNLQKNKHLQAAQNATLHARFHIISKDLEESKNNQL